jgi:hypothetical protein
MKLSSRSAAPPLDFIGSSDERFGLFSGGHRIIPNAPGRTLLAFQVKGWESAYGSNYEKWSTLVILLLGSANLIFSRCTQKMQTSLLIRAFHRVVFAGL